MNARQRRTNNRAVFLSFQKGNLLRSIAANDATHKHLAAIIASPPPPPVQRSGRYIIRQAIRRALVRAGMLVRTQPIARES
jgi:hypothetical protein